MYHVDGDIMDFKEAMQFRYDNSIENLTYNVIKKFKIIDINILQLDDDGKYFFEYLPGYGEWDIIYNIESNLELKVCVNNNLFLKSEKLKLITCCLVYHKFSMRIYVDPFNVPDEIYVKFKSVLLDSELRYDLRFDEVNSGDVCYMRGMMYKI